MSLIRSNLHLAGRLGRLPPTPSDAPTRTAAFLDGACDTPPPVGIPGFAVRSCIGGGGQAGEAAATSATVTGRSKLRWLPSGSVITGMRALLRERW